MAISMQIWCHYQDPLDGEEKLICTAHLAEGRVFNCPYKSNEDRLKSTYPCVDYKLKTLNVTGGDSDGAVQAFGRL